MSELRNGTFLNNKRYEILEMLGKGGFSYTYLAKDYIGNTIVTIKESFIPDKYYRDDSSGRVNGRIDGDIDQYLVSKNNFNQEFQILKSLKHSNIVSVFDFFEDNNTYYYTMEYIDGITLKNYLKEHHSLDEDTSVKIIKTIANAVQFIHNRKICHYDINPNNIMLRSDSFIPILIDFGLAKQYTSMCSDKTENRTLTIAYSPLELFEKGGIDSFSPQTDIFSLGATLYTSIVGDVPPSLKEIWHGALKEKVCKMSFNIQEAILASMQIIKEQRPVNVMEFLSIL